MSDSLDSVLTSELIETHPIIFSVCLSTATFIEVKSRAFLYNNLTVSRWAENKHHIYGKKKEYGIQS